MLSGSFFDRVSDSGAASFVEQGTHRLGPHQLFQSFEVCPKNRLTLDGVLQALQIRIKCCWAGGWQRVDHPALVTLASYEIALPQVCQMLGDDDLGFPQNRLNVADAQWRNGQEIENPKPGFVAQAFVYREQLHITNISLPRYKARTIFASENFLNSKNPFVRRG